MANLGKIVIVAALDGTYQRVGFGSILNLVPLAESVVKLSAVCMICFKDAAYTKRIGTETAVTIFSIISWLGLIRTEAYNITVSTYSGSVYDQVSFVYEIRILSLTKRKP